MWNVDLQVSPEDSADAGLRHVHFLCEPVAASNNCGTYHGISISDSILWAYFPQHIHAFEAWRPPHEAHSVEEFGEPRKEKHENKLDVHCHCQLPCILCGQSLTDPILPGRNNQDFHGGGSESDKTVAEWSQWWNHINCPRWVQTRRFPWSKSCDERWHRKLLLFRLNGS